MMYVCILKDSEVKKCIKLNKIGRLHIQHFMCIFTYHLTKLQPDWKWHTIDMF